MKCLKLSVLALLAAKFSFAQDIESTTKIDSITIKSRGKINLERNEFSHQAQATEVLGSYLLERNNSHYLDQTLGTMAGVQVDKRTQFGGQRVVVRGYGNDQKFNNWGVKFYLNSAPITNTDGVTILEDIDFSLINKIEVIKGPAATRYGGGTGGVVRFYAMPETQKGTRLSESVAVGSFGLFQTNTRVDVVSEKNSLMVNYGHLESQGYRPRGSSRKNNYAFMGNFKLGTQQSLMVYASHNNSFEGVTGQISLQDYYDKKDPGNGAYARKNAANHFISNRAIVVYQWDILSNLSNKTSIFYHHLDTKRTAAGAAENTQQPSYGARSVFSWHQSFSREFRHNIELGGEYLISRPLISNYRFDGSLDKPDFQTKPLSKGTYFKYNNYSASVFLTDRMTYTPWGLSLLLGLSGNTLGYDRTDLLAYPGLLSGYNKNASFHKKFPIVFTPHMALQKTWKKQIFNLSYSEGYNAPTASTAYISALGAANDNLRAERAKMWDFSIHGLLLNSNIDYQFSLFNIKVQDKLTQLWADDGAGGTYSYWSNTGVQHNRGLELSIGYLYTKPIGIIRKIEPYFNWAAYDFKYKTFQTKGKDYSGNRVVGVPKAKYSIGLDLDLNYGFYLRNTFNYLSNVYTDFANTIDVKGYHQYNAKFGYKKNFGKWMLDAYFAGNNLTSQSNYTFLFVGNAVGDTDLGNGYPVGVTTDVNPGPAKAYYFGGASLKYTF